MMQHHSLKRRISNAFKDIPYPGDEAIAYRHPTGGELSDEGRIEIYLRGRQWNELKWSSTAKSIGVPIQSALDFMSPQARLYYLPFFMISCLDDRKASEVLFIFICLNLKNDAGQHVINALSTHQLDVVLDWLSYIIGRDNIADEDPYHPAVELQHMVRSRLAGSRSDQPAVRGAT